MGYLIEANSRGLLANMATLSNLGRADKLANDVRRHQKERRELVSLPFSTFEGLNLRLESTEVGSQPSSTRMHNKVPKLVSQSHSAPTI
jgi:hypothetical protein